MNMTGESKMTQQLSILTGCSAGATVSSFLFGCNIHILICLQESFVVVPFELVKIK